MVMKDLPGSQPEKPTHTLTPLGKQTMLADISAVLARVVALLTATTTSPQQQHRLQHQVITITP
jgi:hypothetical protein